ncbi:MAG: C40 family peptidase [Bacteroidota bacterium]|nr:C40 family peptidase [Bacteroidota bacterium]
MKTIRKISLVLVVLCLLASCSNVKRINKPTPANSRTRTVTKETRNTSSTTTKREKEMTNSDIYASSMKELKQYGSNLTDYCISWVGTPYKAGGTTKQGVDCSGFVCAVYKDMYDIQLSRRSADMTKDVTILSSKNRMKEGDLIFFGKGRINHVGIFIRGDKFIHASSSKGVIVSSLEEKYWKENYNSCGHHPKRK